MVHLLSLHEFKPQDLNQGGYRLKATKKNFPILQGMSFYKLLLHPRGLRAPHWHANADELGYCLSGTLLISMYGNYNLQESFIVSKGDVFFIPSGYLHSVENIGESDAEILLQFSNEDPEDFELTSVFEKFTNAVLGNTWDVKSSYFEDLKRPFKTTIISELKESSKLTEKMKYTSDYQYKLESSSPLISNQGGNAKVARENVWPILKRQAVYLLKLTGTGMREPHWHPETAEMGYVAKGRGRMSIISPSGNVDTYIMEQGDLYYIPKSYPHHIENLNSDDLELVIFFDEAMPQDIGFTASIKSFSEENLSSVFSCKKEIFSELPTYYADLFIVEKKNSLD